MTEPSSPGRGRFEEQVLTVVALLLLATVASLIAWAFGADTWGWRLALGFGSFAAIFLVAGLVTDGWF